ncbi:acyltransferase family protein [Paraburkholderia sp. SIMBA_030]|uniref:acyltransferase family protein n=1 Tax=Paraburkholderia sp. SIMBA_030 TaxID=3085773 RepID=UPI0039795282
MQTNENRYATLDGIRGIAALFVVTGHLPYLFAIAGFRHAFLAVDLFFVMSGFVLARSYEDRLLSGHTNTRSFMRARVLRLYPLYILGIIAGVASAFLDDFYVACTAITVPKSIALALAPAAFMLPAFVNIDLYPFDRPAWSLMNELIANYLYARFLPRLSKRTILLVVSVTWLMIVFVTSWRTLNAGFTWQRLPVGPVRVIFSFLIGVLIHRGAPTTRTVSNAAALLIIAVVVGTLALDVPRRFDALYVIVSVTVIFPAVVFAATRFEPQGWFRKACAAGGLASYGIYVLHAPLGGMLNTFGLWVLGLKPEQVAMTGLPFILVISALAILLDRSYSPAIRRALTKGWISRRARMTTPATPQETQPSTT